MYALLYHPLQAWLVDSVNIVFDHYGDRLG